MHMIQKMYDYFKENKRCFFKSLFVVLTDRSLLPLAKHAYDDQPIGETSYHSSTDVRYVSPAHIYQKHLVSMRNRSIKTASPIPYNQTISLEDRFTRKYPQSPKNEEVVQYHI